MQAASGLQGVRAAVLLVLTLFCAGVSPAHAATRCRELETQRERLMRDREKLEGAMKSADKQLTNIARSLGKQVLRMEGIRLKASDQLTLKTEQIADKLGRIYDGKDQSLKESDLEGLMLNVESKAAWSCPLDPLIKVPAVDVDLAQVASKFSKDYEYRYGKAPDGKYPGIAYDQRVYAIKKSAFMLKLQKTLIKLGGLFVSRCEAERALAQLSLGLPVSPQQRAKYQRLVDKQTKIADQQTRVETILMGVELALGIPDSASRTCA